MKIEVCHNTNCTFWQKTFAELQSLLKELNLAAELEEVLIKNDEEAKVRRFFGSPQVCIDGQDIDPMARKMTNFHVSGCRLYFYQDQTYDFPPREMLKKAIMRFTRGT